MYMYVINIDLALLTSIQLGEQALQGSDVDSCSLNMQSNNFCIKSYIEELESFLLHKYFSMI